jgi:hypothetical protein
MEAIGFAIELVITTMIVGLRTWWALGIWEMTKWHLGTWKMALKHSRMQLYLCASKHKAASSTFQPLRSKTPNLSFQDPSMCF